MGRLHPLSHNTVARGKAWLHRYGVLTLLGVYWFIAGRLHEERTHELQRMSHDVQQRMGSLEASDREAAWRINALAVRCAALEQQQKRQANQARAWRLEMRKKIGDGWDLSH